MEWAGIVNGMHPQPVHITGLTSVSPTVMLVVWSGLIVLYSDQALATQVQTGYKRLTIAA
jgi:hypothetical protein